MTTCIGLINACTSFAHQMYPKFNYDMYVLGFTLTVAIFSNLGLQRILAIAVPIMAVVGYFTKRTHEASG